MRQVRGDAKQQPKKVQPKQDAKKNGVNQDKGQACGEKVANTEGKDQEQSQVEDSAGTSWATVARRGTRRKRNEIVGTSQNIETGIRAAERRRWLFIGNLDETITETDMKNHISKIVEHNDFECSKLSTRYKTNCYKVAIKAADVEPMTDPQNWAEGIKIGRYIFYDKWDSNQDKSKNFQKGPSATAVG